MSEIAPDTKDWTWTIDTACAQCGLDAGAVPTADLPAALRRGAAGWAEVLAAPTAATRTRPGTWSVLEYACHVRDVCLVFTQRSRQMLTEADPVFADWDGEAAAAGYGSSDPARVADEVVAAIEAYAAALARLDGAGWDRGGVRGDGKRFTVATLARYGLHEVAHHGVDAGIVARH